MLTPEEWTERVVGAARAEALEAAAMLLDAAAEDAAAENEASGVVRHFEGLAAAIRALSWTPCPGHALQDRTNRAI